MSIRPSRHKVPWTVPLLLYRNGNGHLQTCPRDYEGWKGLFHPGHIEREGFNVSFFWARLIPILRYQLTLLRSFTVHANTLVEETPSEKIPRVSDDAISV